MLKLMYITNRPEIAQIAEASGVDRIFVDLEYIGKADRQGGMDTVQSRHTLEDVRLIANTIQRSELLVRINPIHNATDQYFSSEEEIDVAIANGATILMLPFFQSVEEVKRFLAGVKRRAQTMLLVETPEAVEQIDDILKLPGIDAIHIGLNDLSLGYGLKFMFEPLANGIVERLCYKCRDRGIPYGFGGIASPGKGLIPAEMIIKEHYRLGSTCAILSRTFCNTEAVNNLEEIRTTFMKGVSAVRSVEAECQQHIEYFARNRRDFLRAIRKIEG